MAKTPFGIHIADFVADAVYTPMPADPGGAIRLNHNEATGLISRSLLRDIFLRAGTALATYPSYDELHNKIAAYLRVPATQIQTTDGSDDAIPKLVRLLFSGSKPALLVVPTFPTYERALRLEKVPVHVVPYKTKDDAFQFPLAEVMSSVQSGKVQGVMICNPGNPLGTPVSDAAITKLIAATKKKKIPLIIDEAYIEFLGTSAVQRVGANPHLIILRTFSKTFGLAGLRLGVVVAHPSIIAELKKLILPWEVNHMAVATALVLLKHVQHFKTEIKHTIARREKLATLLKRYGIHTYASAANFLVCRPTHVAGFLQILAQHTILVKPQAANSTYIPLLKDCVRISVPGKDIAAAAFGALTRACTEYKKKYD